MAPTATFAPVARPRLAAASFLPADPSGRLSGRAVIAEAVALAFAIRTDVARGAHDLDVTALLLAR